MADKLKVDVIDVEFVAGEQPTATKLTQSVAQLKVAIDRISRAIGDLYTQQSYSGSGGIYTLEDIPTMGPNLSRLLGSGGWLNPRQQGRIRQTYQVIFAGGNPSGLHERKKFFKFPFPPILFKQDGAGVDAAVGTDNWTTATPSSNKWGPSYNDVSWAITHPGSPYTDVVSAGPNQKIANASRVSSLEALTAAPQFYVDYEDGAIYLAAGLYADSGTGTSITGTAPNMTLTGAGTNIATTDIVGATITISGSTTAANDGAFTVASATATSISYTNASGVAEAFPGTWSVAEAFQIAYECDSFSDSYDGASFNIIPDVAQTTPLCTVTLVSGSTYQIVTPNAREARGRHGTAYGSVTLSNDMYPVDQTSTYSSYTTVTPANNPMGSYQITLPRFITENLSNGDVIPDGYIQIWDDTDSVILSGGAFTYVNSTTVRCAGISLTAGTTRYRLVVPGTSALSTLYHLRHGYFNHRHTGKHDTYDLTFDGHRLSHAEMIHLFDEGDNSTDSFPGFVPSSVGATRNPHPQYFHRYGYQYGNSITDTGNVDNAFLGDLILSSTSKTISIAADSYSIYFGSPVVGGSINYDQSDNAIKVSTKDFRVEQRVSSIGADAIGSVGERVLPRIFVPMGSLPVDQYILIEEIEDSNATYGNTRLYAASVHFGGYGGVIRTYNARWTGTAWSRDSSGKFAYAEVSASDEVSLYYIDATAYSSWSDAQWTSLGLVGLTQTPSFSWGAYSISADNPVLKFKNVTSGANQFVSNPDAAVAVTKNALYAKNIMKAWGRITTGGSPSILDGFGISAVAVSGTGILCTLTSTIVGPSPSVVATPVANTGTPSTVLLSVEVVSTTQVKLYAYNTAGAGANLDLSSSAIVACIMICGEVA
jgi:hypothetical protein